MTLPRILRHPSTKVKSYNKKSEVSLLIDPYSENLLLRDIEIDQEFDIIKTLHESSFSKTLLATTHTKERLVLKVIPQNLEDFYRELNYNYFLSPHPNVVKCYNVSILWDDSFVFPLEYAPFGNLSGFISQDSCLVSGAETAAKLVAKQLASAVEFIHGLKLVHRDISPENVLVFKQDLSQIKLCDFGSTRPAKSLVVCLKQDSCKDVYKLPPEICHLVKGESYYVHPSSDVWQLGILIYFLLTGGGEPWQSADDILDPTFSEFVYWLRRKNLRIPEPFQIFAPRLLRLFKRMFEPKFKKRCEAREVHKYLEDEWIAKLYRGSSFRGGVLERKASSSTSRSRSTGRSRNSSMRRKSVRSSDANANANQQKESSTGPPDSCIKISGSGRDKLNEVDKDFVKERVGQWILEAASVKSNILTVPSQAQFA